MICYTDGSAHPTNPGPGGYGVVVVDEQSNKIIDTYSKQYNTIVTNNEMELKAILYVMINYGKNNPIVTVYSDSSYAINSLTLWKNNWKSKGWLKSNNQQPENLELIQAYDQLEQLGYQINLQKVKGHNGNKYNELADLLARNKNFPINFL